MNKKLSDYPEIAAQFSIYKMVKIERTSHVKNGNSILIQAIKQWLPLHLTGKNTLQWDSGGGKLTKG